VSEVAEADRPGRTAAHLLRDRAGAQRVTNIELFFDLVYVFAVTQMSHYLLDHPTVRGALQDGLLLMVWLVWSYTTWVTNWLDPEQMAVRLLLVLLMLVSLAMSASLPRAFADLGLWVGGAYAVQQIGRTVFMVIALRGHRLQDNFERILAWCLASGALAVAGGVAHGLARDLLWLGAVSVDLIGGLLGFATPWLGRSRTSDWTIEGGHFAERCEAFILIALGESIVIIGTTLAGVKSVTAASVTGFIVAFATSVTLWWLYFDQSAAAAAEKLEGSDDPGRLGRWPGAVSARPCRIQVRSGASCPGRGWPGSSRSRCWPWRHRRSPPSRWPPARPPWWPPSRPPTGCRGCRARPPRGPPPLRRSRGRPTLAGPRR
jgi:low temperature requirement protein LtrA